MFRGPWKEQKETATERLLVPGGRANIWAGTKSKERKKTQNKSGTPDALSLSGPRSLLHLKPALSLRTPCFDSRQTSSCRLGGGGGLEEEEEEPAEMEAPPWEPGISHGRRSPL